MEISHHPTGDKVLSSATAEWKRPFEIDRREIERLSEAESEEMRVRGGGEVMSAVNFFAPV
jgi:hypothetical protein